MYPLIAWIKPVSENKSLQMKIAFIDFEFGQIYGSWRRDFLVTEAAVLIYDTKKNRIKFAETVLKPNTNLVMRKCIGLIQNFDKKYILIYNCRKK